MCETSGRAGGSCGAYLSQWDLGAYTAVTQMGAAECLTEVNVCLYSDWNLSRYYQARFSLDLLLTQLVNIAALLKRYLPWLHSLVGSSGSAPSC